MKEVRLCFHCGNKTQMELVTTYKHNIPEVEYEPGYGEIQIGEYWDVYNLFLCPVCQKVTLELKSSSTFECGPDGTEYWSEKVLYPLIESQVIKFPSGVKEAFEAAHKVRNIDGAITSLALRRTLERMCKDKGAEGKDLYRKLKYLSDNGVIPPILSVMSSIIKDIGNEAAHGDDVEFDQQLVSSLFKFTEIILEYVYVIPRHLKKIQFDMGIREEENQKPTVEVTSE
ncbi:DUF4145 domain-containing protein [Bacillus sp. TH22]|uniref:DUF4145 domain-containing protein n=1 Tax=Bacillus mycoides TaxID=1405 RepID=A0A1W6A769_BACMY|nr:MULTISPECIES: DUF4145 domain-containing protein [Bacillus]MBT2579981.1 DUF4145 domain-containing protein [Bacillus sp. ISL-8]ARJ21698.1 hypothetical protein B7492_10715 [Bacillus mycoides]MBK5448126.1 DUF4145 domain-containing protein [Bacillus sp. TH22]MCQ6565789.1 DUF4145 domain-containing protein [Bacillus mycoides]HDR7621664.1 DUF4145 domain-containing protein [Bacillus mycoides]